MIKNYAALNVVLFFACFLLVSCHAHTSFGQDILKLEKEIMLSNVRGRIDHIDLNVEDNIAYVAALGNNCVKVIDLKKGLVLYTITGLSEPQGIAYIPKHHELVVANGGNGACDFFDAITYKKLATVKFDDDADDVRYDAAADKVYIGYGSGGIAVIDVVTHQQMADIKLPSHPESFQLDLNECKIWVNLPNSGCIGAVDIKQGKLIDQWKRFLPRFNFPMAYDSVQHRIMVGYRVTATLKIIDTRTGKDIFSTGMVGDVDDFYWDDKSKQLIVSGGAGAINIFKQTGDNTYKKVADIKTSKGARTSLWVPQKRMYLLCAAETDTQPARLQIYRLAE